MQFFELVLDLLGFPGGSEGRIGRYERIGCLIGLSIIGPVIVLILIAELAGG
jgi:hypothetical protein